MANKEKQNILKILGLAIGLPSSILGTFFLMYFLIENKYISSLVGLSIILLIVGYTFFLMVRYANKK